MLSANSVKTDTIAPRMVEAAIDPTRYQTSAPTTPPAASEPISLPSRRRQSAPRAKTPKIVNGLNGFKKLIQSKSWPCDASGAGAGSGSPSITRIMRLMPAVTPPAKSPLLNFGEISSSMMRREVTSVSAPSRPYPTSMRSLRSFLAMTSNAPSSIFRRPIFQASATRIEYCSMVSGSVVDTIRTAIWLPFLASKSFRVCVSDAMSPLESVPV